MYPLSPDAYILLAEDEWDMDKKMTLLEKAIEVGGKDLGTDFFKENKGHFWSLIETIIDYLIGNRQLPTQSPQYVGMGDENEAIAYAQSNSHLWAEAEEFLQLFLKNTNS